MFLSPKVEEILKTKGIEEAIVAFVKELDYCSFTEVQSAFKNAIPTTGDIEVGLDENCVIWSGLSKELADLIGPGGTLIKQKRIFYHPGSPLAYAIDGCLLKLPLVKGNRHYKKPHWLVTMLRTVPMKAKQEGHGKARKERK